MYRYNINRLRRMVIENLRKRKLEANMTMHSSLLVNGFYNWILCDKKLKFVLSEGNISICNYNTYSYYNIV